MSSLYQILYLISTALLVPVILVLLGFLAWSFLELGGFLHEWRERRQGAKTWQQFVMKLRKGPNPPEPTTVVTFFERTDYPGLLAAFAQRGKTLHPRAVDLGKLVSDLEIEASGRLARMNLGIRVGPMLGLMGTLIPMGPALIGLSMGNIEVMVTNLVVAFSTTVLGLLVGALCYAMSLFRRRWYSHDLSDIEYVYRCRHGEGGTN